jgi:hypothetical protein
MHCICQMKQIDLTSKLVLAIIGLTSVSALLVPTYATTNTNTPTTIPNNTTYFDDIGYGQTPSAEDIRNLVSDAVQQLKVVAISSPTREIQPNSGVSLDAECPKGMFATGGGFSTDGSPVDMSIFQPNLSSGDDIRSGDTPDAWHTVLSNSNVAPLTANSWVVCVGLGP